MEIYRLIDNTVNILKLLINLYDSGQIDISDFEIHTELKIKFLSDNLHMIASDKKRAEAEWVLRLCHEKLGYFPHCI